MESLGAELYIRINNGKNSDYILNSDSLSAKQRKLSKLFTSWIKT